jgi:hypothetical protein
MKLVMNIHDVPGLKILPLSFKKFKQPTTFLLLGQIVSIYDWG